MSGESERLLIMTSLLSIETTERKCEMHLVNIFYLWTENGDIKILDRMFPFVYMTGTSKTMSNI